MKRFHGLSRARGWGLRSILFQAKLTAIAVNLKRIAAITGKETRPVIAFLRKSETISKNLFRTLILPLLSVRLIAEIALFQWFQMVPSVICIDNKPVIVVELFYRLSES
jgi:hypothetical protein